MDLSSPTLDATRERLVARWGAAVDPWWERLPAAVAELERAWDVVVGDPVGRGNTSLVMRCRRADGRAAVLKVTPDGALAAAEAAALTRWAPSGRVPAVWGHDAALGALLLEAIPSEAPLAELNVAVELDAVAALIRGLHGSGAPALTDGVVPLAERVEFVFDHWIERRRGDVDALRRGHELARALAADATPDPVLLHGDLHAGNVLDGGPERGLVAIDPRPCVGDAAFDAVDWPFHGTDDPRTWKPRSRELAHALGLDPERLWAWCRALAPMLGVAL